MVKKKQKTLRRLLYEDISATQLAQIGTVAESLGYKLKFENISTYPHMIILDALFDLDDEDLTLIYNKWLSRTCRSIPRDVELVSRKLSRRS